MSEEIILKSPFEPVEIPVQSMGELMNNKLKTFKDKTLIIEGKSGTSLTVSQLVSEANAVAVALLNRGLSKSDIISCFSKSNLQYAVLHFAIYFLGNTFTPSDPSHGVFELENQIRDTSASIIFTSAENASKCEQVLAKGNLPHVRSVFVLNGEYKNFIPYTKLLEEGNNQMLPKIPYFDINPKEDVFTIMFTSGTSGLPKGAMITHYSFIASIFPRSLRFYDNILGCTHYPFGHISSCAVLSSFIYHGLTFVMVDIDEIQLLEAITKYKPHFTTIFPSFGLKLTDTKFTEGYDLSSLKAILHGGIRFPANVSKKIVEMHKIAFREGYGMTEFLGATRNDDVEYIPGNCGKVAPNSELKIIDLNSGQSLGPNKDGEILLRGPCLFKGYLNNEQATRDTIDKDGWIHTGDIGHYDNDGRIFIADRLKELIKFEAYSPAPAEIESCLMQHDCVQEAVVIGVKHHINNEWPRAFVKTKGGKNVTEEELKKYIAENMGDEKRLRAGVVFVDEIPKTIIGKFDRQFFKNKVRNELITE